MWLPVSRVQEFPYAFPFILSLRIWDLLEYRMWPGPLWNIGCDCLGLRYRSILLSILFAVWTKNLRPTGISEVTRTLVKYRMWLLGSKVQIYPSFYPLCCLNRHTHAHIHTHAHTNNHSLHDHDKNTEEHRIFGYSRVGDHSRRASRAAALIGIGFRRWSSFSEKKHDKNTEENRIFGGTRESGTIRVALRAPLR